MNARSRKSGGTRKNSRPFKVHGGGLWEINKKPCSFDPNKQRGRSYAAMVTLTGRQIKERRWRVIAEGKVLNAQKRKNTRGREGRTSNVSLGPWRGSHGPCE